MSKDSSGTISWLRETARQRRVARRWTQSRLGAAAGLSRKWVSDFERGQVDPTFSSLAALCDALEIELHFEGLPAFDCGMGAMPKGAVSPTPSPRMARSYLKARSAFTGIGFDAMDPEAVHDMVGLVRVMMEADLSLTRKLPRHLKSSVGAVLDLCDQIAELNDNRALLIASLAGPHEAISALAKANIPPLSAIAAEATIPRSSPLKAKDVRERWWRKGALFEAKEIIKGRHGYWTTVSGPCALEEARFVTQRRFPNEELYAWRAPQHGIVALAVMEGGLLSQMVLRKGWCGARPDLLALLAGLESENSA